MRAAVRTEFKNSFLASFILMLFSLGSWK